MINSRRQDLLFSLTVSISLCCAIYLNYQSRNFDKNSLPAQSISEDRIEVQMPDIKIMDHVLEKFKRSVSI